ncbi:MAG TPA: class I SAM-dependent methyltransferase [Dongiaceae bacterium]|jgi:SAM-dependent methyltransferase
MNAETDIAVAAMRGGEYDDGALYDAEYGGIDADGRFFLDLATACGPRVLDLGCGTGRLAIPLCRDGKQVTGLDAMPSMLNHARRKAAGLPIRWVDGDFRCYDLGETYDLAISCAHAFQGLLTEDDQRRYLACAARHLVPGGVLAFDTRNPSPHHLQFPLGEANWQSFVDPAGDTIDCSGTQRYDAATGLMRYDIFRTNRRTGARQSAHITIKFTPLERLRGLLTNAGFEIRQAYGTHLRGAWTPDSPEIVVVAGRR